jgi:hypothetical protein
LGFCSHASQRGGDGCRWWWWWWWVAAMLVLVLVLVVGEMEKQGAA